MRYLEAAAGQFLDLPGPVTPQSTVSLELSADSGLVAPKHLGHLGWMILLSSAHESGIVLFGAGAKGDDATAACPPFLRYDLHVRVESAG